ncbi:Uma2 family endonuclease [Altericista sp. CCNU0014]|uniref:Uma2 family endonuclease n=1 Tax=Altericista sp. CCNU0014 TaxID=3082949 RepID=UPI00384BD950
MVLQIPRDRQAPLVTWEPLPADFVLPDDPVENIQQPTLAAALTDALGASGLIQPQMLIASNFGIVATLDQKTVVKAPDWLYVPQTYPTPDGAIRRSYTPLFEGQPVAIVMEFLSDHDAGEYSVRPTFPYGKLYFYEAILKVPTYVIFDPYQLSLEVRSLGEGDTYVLQTPSADGRYWIPELQLFLGCWYGTRLGTTTHWLRWWDASGKLLLWSSEQAERLAAKLRELGVDPDALV